MDGLEHVEPERWLAAAPRPSAVVVPAGCKGAACPFFAACRGRCEAKRQARALRRSIKAESGINVVAAI